LRRPRSPVDFTFGLRSTDRQFIGNCARDPKWSPAGQEKTDYDVMASRRRSGWIRRPVCIHVARFRATSQPS